MTLACHLLTHRHAHAPLASTHRSRGKTMLTSRSWALGRSPRCVDLPPLLCFTCLCVLALNFHSCPYVWDWTSSTQFRSDRPKRSPPVMTVVVWQQARCSGHETHACVIGRECTGRHPLHLLLSSCARATSTTVIVLHAQGGVEAPPLPPLALNRCC
jgi:hypothetical protein